jgi:hypothetical protein
MVGNFPLPEYVVPFAMCDAAIQAQATPRQGCPQEKLARLLRLYARKERQLT